MDWARTIATLGYIRQAIAQVDRMGLWRHCLPRVGASSHAIEDASGNSAHPISIQYKEFLRFADGWPAFYQNVDLFGTVEFKRTTESSRRGAELAAAIDDAAFLEAGVSREDLVLIAASGDDLDCFFMDSSGKVYWFAGTLVETFPDFESFFLSMMDYNRLDFQRMKNEASP